MKAFLRHNFFCLRLKTLSLALIAAAVVLMPQRGCVACGLALHDWALAFNIEIPLSVPIFPLAEADFLSSNGLSKIVKKVFWVSDHNCLSKALLVCLPFINKEASNPRWLPISDASSVIALAKQSIDGVSIIGSDKCLLQIALFLDKNSNNNCMQLVIRQKARIRCVIKSENSSFAQEINGQAWVSLVFYQIPGRFLSISVFPIAGTKMSILDNSNYVERLIALGKLKQRVDEIDPYEFDFPDF